MKKWDCCAQGQGHSKGPYDQSMTVSTIYSELLIFLLPNLIWWYIIISQNVLWRNWIAVFIVSDLFTPGTGSRISNIFSSVHFSRETDFQNYEILWLWLLFQSSVLTKHFYTSDWYSMKEVHVCFSEMELVQKWWMPHEDRWMLESKGVPKDPGITRHTRGVSLWFCCHQMQVIWG